MNDLEAFLLSAIVHTRDNQLGMSVQRQTEAGCTVIPSAAVAMGHCYSSAK